MLQHLRFRKEIDFDLINVVATLKRQQTTGENYDQNSAETTIYLQNTYLDVGRVDYAEMVPLSVKTV